MTAADIKPGAEPVNVRATRYEVSCLPPDDINYRHFMITIEWRGDDRWAVCDGEQRCLGTDGFFVYEPMPSHRTDEFIDTHRFSLDEARALAEDAARKLTVNGLTVADVLARSRSKDRS